MKKTFTSLCLLLLITTAVTFLSSFDRHKLTRTPAQNFPYKQAGLTDKQAAAHLISRFSFGVTPEQVEDVARTGLEKWFAEQVEGSLPDESMASRLADYHFLSMSNQVIVSTYPKGGQVLKMAVRDGVIRKDSLDKSDKKSYKEALRRYMQDKGLQPQSVLLRELVGQKILRAVYANNQLREVMTDFWFNHFNVAVAKAGVPQFVTSYERDVIRPNVLGNFEELLLATARSPAMLTYLDNNKSSAAEENRLPGRGKPQRKRQQTVTARDTISKENDKPGRRQKVRGLNENYAREIMELHTLGVEGGYTQSDVTQAARVLTGWGVNPALAYNLKATVQPSKERVKRHGFVYDDNFLFAANKHDKGEKKVLGQHFAPGGGYEEGIKLIHLLAVHPSTAKFISKKLAVRFVSDEPPQSLVDKMAKTFLHSKGSIKEVLATMVAAPEFWSKEALRTKTKSPFELAVSAVRSTHAQVKEPFQLYQWITKMGQKMYNYQAPTGFPDNGQYWINSGSLLNRMNFGLALAAGRIPGVRLNLPGLNGNREPESAVSALQIYSKLLLPERDVDETVKRLTPMLNDPDLEARLDEAVNNTPSGGDMQEGDIEMMAADSETGKKHRERSSAKPRLRKDGVAGITLTKGNDAIQGQVVGIIIGSPEFQRR